LSACAIALTETVPASVADRGGAVAGASLGEDAVDLRVYGV
jgi:hypothetical protein